MMPGEERPDPLPDVGARTTWEWMGDSGLLLQRWTIPIEGPPDDTAVIGWNAERETFLQHYFDDRPVERTKARQRLSRNPGTDLRKLSTDPCG